MTRFQSAPENCSFAQASRHSGKHEDGVRHCEQCEAVNACTIPRELLPGHSPQLRASNFTHQMACFSEACPLHSLAAKRHGYRSRS